MRHSDRVLGFVGRIHAAGGAAFRERDEGSGVYVWRTVLGRWPFEVQVDRFALEVRCYVGDELFCTGRIPEAVMESLLESRQGSGDPAAMAEFAGFVDGVMRTNSRRFLRPPHADRHPDRRSDLRQESTIRALPGRGIHEPA